ncbi:MAG: galactose-1-phosphate uridylyltransferase [Candidatus Omnitrophica bacterium]|nr:galactose-1-phosphate uridylyltransferase [Candidatus Omnitrophota bacterium]
MPQLRKDPVIGGWVIISTERQLRPTDFRDIKEPTGESNNKFCPFDEGNENKTPPEIYAIRKPWTLPDTTGWDVRVVSNKYPALRIEGPLGKKGMGLFDSMNGIGAHEIVIETPSHNDQMEDYSADHLEKVISTYQQRSLDLKKDPRFKYIIIFKNFGKEAGASLHHSHSQIIATPVTPKRVKEELAGSREYYEYKERCIFCDIIDTETERGERIVATNSGFIAITPFASISPFEMWILPLNHNPDFDKMEEMERKSFADILRLVLKKLSVALKKPPYNFALHSAPSRFLRPGYWQTIDRDYHWHLEIIPRLTSLGGFEWGTGFYINPTMPEDAAKFLRELKI